MASLSRNLAKVTVAVAVLAAGGVTVAAPADAPAAPAVARVGVGGRVLDGSQPLASARVYVYRLSDLALEKAVTDERGDFQFDRLPAGLYKIIAHKAGFVPAVVRLTRATAQAYQFLELELVQEERSEVRDGADFWAARAEIPPDVLRDIQVTEIADAARRAAGGGRGGGRTVSDPPRLLAEMQAMTGIDQGGGPGDGYVTQGAVGLEGRVGNMRLGLEGDYWQLEPSSADAGGAPTYSSGEASALSLELASDRDMLVQLSSRSNRLLDVRDAAAAPVDFEHYGLHVRHAIGERGRSDFSAQYTSESNFHRHGGIDPLDIPEASRSWRVEGTYTTELDERSSLQAGVRYRQSAFGFDEAGLDSDLTPQHDRVDLFGRAGTQVRPSVLVEYGMYTALRDGSLSLSPRGGMVLQIDPTWQATLVASHKVYDEAPLDLRDFSPTRIAHDHDQVGESCEDNEKLCYQLLLVHQTDRDESFSVGATQREFDETVRLYFSDDLSDRLESLYLVPGDQVPEVQVAVSRRITPHILARLQSSLASGGGGVFYATDQGSYENRVRYLVTSIDTHFDGTATGLFVAFHHLQQTPESLGAAAAPQTAQLEVERLDLMLTQDLNILLDMSPEMALRLNMQLSRGSWPFSGGNDDELRRRLLGGIALKF